MIFFSPSKDPSDAKATQNAGFSLISLVLLLMTFALGAASIFTTMLPGTTSSGMKITNARVDALRIALSNYEKSHGGAAAGIPPAALSALVNNDGTVCVAINTPATPATYLTLQGWCGPYIDQSFSNDYQTDGWGQVFIYSSSPKTLTSCGPDRICGNGDDITFTFL